MSNSPAAAENQLPPKIDDTHLTIIVTHFNYSDVIGKALRSVVNQTHRNFECLVVDDHSEPDHRKRLRAEVSALADPRIRILELPENRGQTNAVFRGLEQTSGEFVSLLDPDDLYAPEFLEKMLKCHLNPITYAAVAACEMGLFRVNGPRLTQTYLGFKSDCIKSGTLARAEASLADFGFSAYHPPDTTGWLWCTTSSLMFRRDALLPLQRKTFIPELKICADTYCVIGAHMLGGTLFIDEVLSWRGIHARNAVEVPWLVSREQQRHRAEFIDDSKKIRRFVAQTMIDNGSFFQLREEMLVATLSKNFALGELKQLLAKQPALLRLLKRNSKKRKRLVPKRVARK